MELGMAGTQKCSRKELLLAAPTTTSPYPRGVTEKGQRVIKTLILWGGLPWGSTG